MYCLEKTVAGALNNEKKEKEMLSPQSILSQLIN